MTKSLSIKSLFIQLICLIIIAGMTYFTFQFSYTSTKNIRGDYKTFYKSLTSRKGIYKPYQYITVKPGVKKITVGELKKMPISTAVNLNTPTMNIILKLLISSSRTLKTDSLIWTLSSLAGAALSIYFLLLLFKKKYQVSLPFLPALLFLILSWPAIVNNSMGQVTFLLLPILSLAFTLGALGFLFVSSILLGLLASLKLFFLLFLFFFLARKQWGLAFTFILSFALFTVAPLVHLPLNEYKNFLHLVLSPGTVARRSINIVNASLLGFIIKASSYFTLKLTYSAAKLLSILLSACLLLAYMILQFAWLNHIKDRAFEIGFSLIIVLSLLMSPLGWIYYFPFLLIPAAFIYETILKREASLGLFIALLLALYLPTAAWVSIPRHVHSSFVILSAMLKYFSPTISLALWSICILETARIYTLPSFTQHANKRIFIEILIGSILLTLLCLFLNYAFPYYFTPHTRQAILALGPRYWIN